ncbi:MAG: orotidine-5'-phosphate decarboxylase [Pseudomonadota bacterium]
MPFLANPIFCALDTTDAGQAVAWARAVRPHVGGVKIGMEFFYANGRAGYEAVAAEGAPIFLDLKLHDIPNTVAGGLRALMTLDPAPALVTVHTTGGPGMMRAAKDAAAETTKVIGVTIMTSLDNRDIHAVGYSRDGTTADHVLSMSELTRASGLDGVVCSPLEIERVKQSTSSEFLTVVPGIRPASSDVGDQKRVASPGAAVKAGADVIVVGRAITKSADPAASAKAISAEVEDARG